MFYASIFFLNNRTLEYSSKKFSARRVGQVNVLGEPYDSLLFQSLSSYSFAVPSHQISLEVRFFLLCSSHEFWSIAWLPVFQFSYWCTWCILTNNLITESISVETRHHSVSRSLQLPLDFGRFIPPT